MLQAYNTCLLAVIPLAPTLGAMELLLSLLISIGVSLIVFGKR